MSNLALVLKLQIKRCEEIRELIKRCEGIR